MHILTHHIYCCIALEYSRAFPHPVISDFTGGLTTQSNSCSDCQLSLHRFLKHTYHTIPHMVGPSPLRASAAPETTPKKSKYTSLASLMESPPNNNKGRSSHGESGQARPDRRQLGLIAEASRSRSRDRRNDAKEESGNETKKGRLSAWKMMALTVSMGGSQVSRLTLRLVHKGLMSRLLGLCESL